MIFQQSQHKVKAWLCYEAKAKHTESSQRLMNPTNHLHICHTDGWPKSCSVLICPGTELASLLSAIGSRLDFWRIPPLRYLRIDIRLSRADLVTFGRYIRPRQRVNVPIVGFHLRCFTISSDTSASPSPCCWRWPTYDVLVDDIGCLQMDGNYRW